LNCFEARGIREIMFFFPYRGIGGVPVLFLRLAHALAQRHPDVQLGLIDYPDGYMSRHVNDERIEIITLEPGKKIIVDDGAVVVLQSLPLWRLPGELAFQPGVRFLLWHLHPFNIAPGSHWLTYGGASPSLPFRLKSILFASQRRKLRKLVEACHQHNGLVFMDGANLDGVRVATAARITNPVYVPVPGSADTTNQEHAHMKPSTPFRCAWVGRLEDFKIPILVYSMQRVASYSEKVGRPVVFHVVGDGKDVAEILRLRDKLNSSLFTVVVHGVLPLNELDAFLLKYVDLLFAMGTAALEGAKLGLPVVLLDFSYTQITGDYLYRYLFDSQTYTLGSPIKDSNYLTGNKSLEGIMEQLGGDEYATCAERTQRYYLMNHGMESVLGKFIDAVSKTEFTYSMVRRSGLQRPDVPMHLLYTLKNLLSGQDYHISSS